MADERNAKINASLAEANLVPGPAEGLIPADFKAQTTLHVKYGDRELDLGNWFRKGECQAAPSIWFDATASSEKTSYMLFLTDPDAPTPDNPQFAFWRHWVVPGLKPLTHDPSIVGQTKFALTEYLGPGPKDESGPHRYLFLLYREPEGLDLAKEDVGGEEFVQRRSWRPAEFAAKHGLELVGLNWMTCVGDGWKEPA